MSENKGQNFLHGAAIYTIGILIVKVLGFIYKFVIMRLMSDAGYGYFMIAYNIFNMFLQISTAGIPVALSRMISETNAIGREQQKRRVFQVAFWTLTIIGGLGTAAMLIFPRQLAGFMGSEMATQGVFCIAPSLVLVCMVASLRGYAQGHSDMVPTSSSQVIETAVKVLIGLGLTFVLVHRNAEENIVAGGALVGTSISSLATLIFLAIVVSKKFNMRPTVTEQSDVPEPVGTIFLNFMKIAIPVTIAGSLLSIFSMLDSKLILEQLQKIGYTDIEAETLYGIYAKTSNLYNLPYYFVVPFEASIMPAIAAARIRGEKNKAADLAEDCLRIVSMLTIPMALGMLVLAVPCVTLISNCTASQAGAVMMLMAVASYPMCFAVLTSSILPANGNERLPIYSIIIGGVVKVLSNIYLVRIPGLNIYGAALGTILCYLVISIINLIFIRKNMGRAMNLGRIVGKSFVCSAVMAAIVFAVYNVVVSLTDSMLISFAVSVMLGVVVYLIFTLVIKNIRREDLELIPKGDRIADFLHIH